MASLVKRDFLCELPPELALFILSFIDDPRTLARVAQVSKGWNSLLSSESLWRGISETFQFEADEAASLHARGKASEHDFDYKSLTDMNIYFPVSDRAASGAVHRHT
jgi:hypothetical protein